MKKLILTSILLLSSCNQKVCYYLKDYNNPNEHCEIINKIQNIAEILPTRLRENSDFIIDSLTYSCFSKLNQDFLKKDLNSKHSRLVLANNDSCTCNGYMIIIEDTTLTVNCFQNAVNIFVVLYDLKEIDGKLIAIENEMFRTHRNM